MNICGLRIALVVELAGRLDVRRTTYFVQERAGQSICQAAWPI